MKKIVLLLLCFSISSLTFGQRESSEDVFSRDGKVLVETGYSFLGGIFTGGTGLTTLIPDEGDAITTVGIEAGKFISENFALKLQLGIISANGSINSFGGSAKYYIAGSFPIQLGLGILSGSGESLTTAQFNIGYALKLADNIYLEPSIGSSVVEEEALGVVKAVFAMIL